MNFFKGAQELLVQRWTMWAFHYCHQFHFFDYIKEKNFRGDIYYQIYFSGISSPKSLILYFGRCLTYKILRLINFKSTVIVDRAGLCCDCLVLYLTVTKEGGFYLLKRLCCVKLDSSFRNFRYQFLLFKFLSAKSLS